MTEKRIQICIEIVYSTDAITLSKIKADLWKLEKRLPLTVDDVDVVG